MKFIIIGAGDVGTNLCTKLAAQQHDVVLIEKEPGNIDKAIESLDLKVVIGNGASPDILRAAGVDATDYLISVTDSDEVNIAACFVARLLNPRSKRIARSREVDLQARGISAELTEEYFDLIINPDRAGADYLLQLFKIPGAREIVEFANGKVRVLGLTVWPDSALLDLKLNKLKSWKAELPILILAIMRGTKLIIPRGEDKLKAGDILYAATLPEKTKLLFELVGQELHEGKSAMMWGGSGLARTLAHSLESQGTSLKIILSDPEEAALMADEMRSALVLNGEGTDQNLLLEENVSELDAFIAATPDEENNILAALLAKKLGVRTAMALVNKSTYLPLVSAIGVDVVVSSRVAAASTIFRHIHSHSLISEALLQHEGAGFIELDVTDELPLTNKPLKDMDLPHGISISAIIRDDKAIIPGGEDVIREGDRVVIFILKAALKKLERMLGLKLELLA